MVAATGWPEIRFQNESRSASFDLGIGATKKGNLAPSAKGYPAGLPQGALIRRARAVADYCCAPCLEPLDPKRSEPLAQKFISARPPE